MKSKKKIVTLLACAVLLVVGSVMGTMAYLTSQDDVVNTFTVGKVAITMDETDVDDSTADAERDKANTYKLMPGKEYIKDPIIHVGATSEDCWLFVKVENEIAAIEGDNTVAAQMGKDANWTLVEDNVYAYKAIVAAGTDVTVFNTFEIADTITNDVLAGYEGKTIKVTAYAVQAEGFGTYDAAWASAKTELGF